MKKTLALAMCAVALGGFSMSAWAAADAAGQAPKAADAQPAQKVIDVGNTTCPVSGEDVGKITVTMDNHKYHFCCTDCPAKFKKDPGKYIEKMRENPDKYGIKDKSVLPKPGETKPDPNAKVEGAGGMGDMGK